MKKLSLLILLVAILSFLCISYADAYCVGATYNFTCGDTVNQSCVMDRDETTSGSCFRVNLNNIVINCNGYRITGNGSGVGIDVNARTTNFTIKNCQIDGFEDGLYLRDNINTTVFNNSINRNSRYGIHAPGANYTNITNNTINDNGAEGIYIHKDSRWVTIANNRIYNNTKSGIRLNNSFNHTVRNNEIYRNDGYGLFVSNVTYLVVFNNTIYENTKKYGIYLYQSPYANITGNVVYGNENNIIIDTDSDNSFLMNNVAYNAINGNGIQLLSNRNAVLINNTAYDNAADGFNSQNARGVNYVNNTAYGNNGDGFDAISGDRSNYTGNIAYENAYADFLLDSTSNCILINNTAHNSRWGFWLGYNGASDGNVLENNTAYNETEGAFGIDRGSNNNLTNNIAYDSNIGFGLYNGPTTNNILINNVAHDNDGYGFILSSAGFGGVNNNTLFNNTAYNNNDGFAVSSGGGSGMRNNNLTNNVAHHNQYNGFVVMFNSAQNTHLENNLAYNNSVSGEASAGFVIESCSGAVLINNTAQDNLGGIVLAFVENATLTGNTMDSNFYNFALWGDTDAQHNHTISANNLADGKPIFYLKNGNNQSASITASAAFYCIWCDGYRLSDLNFSREAFGVYFWGTNNTEIENMNITYTYNAIRLARSSNNTFNNVNIGANYAYDFESLIGFSNWTLFAERDSLNNMFTNFNFNGVIANFIASDVIMRKAGNLAAPSGYKLINKNIEAKDNSGGGSGAAYLFMNISYTDADIAGMNESSLFIARNNGTWELKPSAFSDPHGVDTANNYVYANITDFGSSFGIIGKSVEQQGGRGGWGSSARRTKCGNGECEYNENYLTCPSDCDAPENPPENISYDCGDLNTRGCQINVSASDVIKFIVKNTTHILQIASLTNNSVNLWIWSNPAHYTISTGETKQFDLDKNNYNDFSITIDSITDNKASLTLKALRETFPSGERTAPQQKKPSRQNLWPWIIVIAVVIVIVAAVIIVAKREKKLKHLGYK